MFACCCLDSNARKRVLSFGCNNFHSTIINVLLLSGSAMVMFENHQSYDDAVNAKSAKLRSRDLMKTVSDMTETMASASDSELLVYFSAKLLELQSAMLVARSDVTPWYNHVFNHVSDRDRAVPSLMTPCYPDKYHLLAPIKQLHIENF